MPRIAQRLASVSGTALVLAAVLSCGDDPAAPADPPPADEPEPTVRILPEGVYGVSFLACEACEPRAVPDYLLVLARGIRGTVQIVGAAESGAALRLIEMRDAGDEADVRGLFAALTIPLAWDWTAAGFRGAVNYGATAVFMPILRRDGEAVECDFEVFHVKHDVGSTTCTASRLPDD
jgi:hypothetical protein